MTTGSTGVKLVVEGMRCQNKCARRIREALEDIPGVASADVRFQGKSATITFTSPQTSVSVVELIQAVRGLDAGLNKSYDAYLPGDDRRARTVVLHVDGMSCMMNCARKVESALATAAGVKSAKVDFDLKQATVVIEPGSRITEDDLIDTVQGAGKKFVASVQVSSPRVVVPTSPAVPILPSLSSSTTPPTTKSHASISIKELPADSSSSRVTIAVSGMTCNSCANSVESALRATAGVESCVVNFATESASVKFIASTIGIRSLIEVVEGIGYGAAVATTSAVVQSDDNRQIDIATWRSTFVVALVFTFPILIVMMLLDNIAPISRGLRTQVFHINGSTWNDLVLFLLATPVQFYCGRRFHIDAWKGVRNRVLGMAFLVSMGTNAAYFFAVFSDLRCLYLGDASFSVPDMYMTSSTLVTFIALGKTLEAVAKGRTNDALRKLFDLQVKVATLVVSDHGSTSEKVVPIELVQRGDVLKVVRGTSVPADGVITQGEGRLDESMLTGESRLIKKSVDDTVLGATMNIDGLFYMRVTGVGRDTALSQIVRLVEDAQTSKAPIQAYADQVAAVFVPVVLVLSTATFLIWYSLGSLGFVDLPQHTSAFLFAFKFAISTLVVACPCALGLATPTAVMVGTGVGASLGILIKGGEPLEAANHVDTVLFDKTGTLTNGTPSVTDIVVVAHPSTDGQEGDDITSSCPDELVRLAASAELGSEHPLGRALVNRAKLLAKPLETPVTFHAVSGKGISVELSDETVHLGNLDYMDKCGLQRGHVDDAVRGRLEAAGKTVIYMGLCDRVVALFGISDAARPDAKATVAQLHARGMAVYMVTGDNRRTAHWIAEQVGIPVHHVMAEVLPSNKVAKVQELQAAGRVVAMVGDGINDAPALAQADLGIAIGAGTDIAMETAQMVLMKSALKDVVVAFDLSQTIYRRIQINFVWAMGYNIVLLPLAAGVLYGFRIQIPPMFAGAAMAFSSVSVVASSLALKWYQPPTTHHSHRHRADTADERTPLLHV